MRRGWGIVLVVLALLAGALAVARDERVPAAGSEIALRELPREARETLALIRAGGPFPYAKDGTVFGNRERLLPRRARGYYGEYWYTDDHYASFRRIRE